jgi:hypothetical protein
LRTLPMRRVMAQNTTHAMEARYVEIDA